MKLLKHLDLKDCHVESNIKGEALLKIFKEKESWPGVIVLDQGAYLGLISRDHFFEFSGQQFGREIVGRRTLKDFLSYSNIQDFILDENMTLTEAVSKVLAREKDTYGPITVLVNNKKHYLLNVHDLFLAHSRQHVELMKELQDSNKFKTELIHIVSHDLKNPLAIVHTYAEMIKEELSDHDEIQSMCSNLIERTQDMTELIMTFLDKNDDNFSMDLLPKKIDFLKFLEKNIRANTPYTEIKNQTLNLVLPNDLNQIIIEADVVKLKSVMDNLISNAIKFSDKDTDINISVQIRNKYTLCSISDHGPGVKDKDKENIFKKFQKSDAKPTDGESSTGLGLYFTRWIIKMHKGDIWVEDNKSEKGATFTFRLPYLETST